MEKNLCGENICGEKMTNMRSGLYINTEGFRDRLSSYSFTWCAGLLRHGGWGVRSQLALSHLNWSNTTDYSHSGQLVSQVSTGPRYLHRLLTTRQADKPATFLEGQQTAFTYSPMIRWVKLKTRKSFGQ